MAKKQRYTKAQQRAYWIGVGISNAVHDKGDVLNHTDPTIRASVRAGYQANNSKDVSHRFSAKSIRPVRTKKPLSKKPAAKKKTARGRR